MEIRGTSCTLYVHKHRDTSLETMSADVHDMMMKVFMESMTRRGSPGDSHSYVWVVCREGLHIHNSSRLEATPRE